MLDFENLDPDQQVRIDTVEFAAGSARLVGTLYRPKGVPTAAVVLNGATGVPQRFYRHFARWLVAERGMACLTYDYSDFGDSAQRPLRQSDATMARWAMVEQPAARDEMRRHYPQAPLWVIGHSLGAMLMPLQDGIEDISRMIVIAGGLVHHNDHPWPYRALALSFWFGPVPLAVKMMGYLPAKTLRLGEDLPASVYWQWRKWCTTPGSYLPEIGAGLPLPDWQSWDVPVDLFALSDDDLIPPDCVWRLGDVYGDVEQTRTELNPKDFGLEKVGHLGMFARRNAALWPRFVPEQGAP